MKIFTDIALRLWAQTSELKKGLQEAGNSANKMSKGIKDSSKSASSNISKLSKDATGAFSQMTGGMNSLSPALSQGVGGFQALAVGARSLSAALGPIGLIIAAIGLVVKALSSYFTGTVEGAQKFASIMGYIKGVLNVVQDAFIALGKWIVWAFENPREAINQLWDLIKQNFINRWQGAVDFFTATVQVFSNGFKALGQLVKSVFNKDAKDEAAKYFQAMKESMIEVGKAGAQMATGIDVDKAIERGSAAMENLKAKATATAKIMADMKKLELDKEYSLIRQQRLETQFQELTLIAANTTLTYKERLDAALAAKEKIIAISEEEVALARRAYENQVALNKQSETSQEDKIKELQLLRELEAVETKKNQRLREAQEKINTSQKGYQLEQEKAAKDLVDKKIAAEQSLADYQKKINEQTLQGRIDNLNKELEESKKALEAGLILQQEYDLRAAETSRRIAEETGKAKLEAEAAINDEREKLAQATAERIDGYLSGDIDKLMKGWDDFFASFKSGAENAFEGLKELSLGTAAALLEISASVTNTLGDLFEAAKNRELKAAGDNAKKREEIEKKYAKKSQKISIAQAIINGALAIVKGFAELGPIGGAISAALIAATTAAQIAVISSQSFAKGGIVYGPTLGLVGEYPGARTDPEVIAPLSKLQNILGVEGGEKKVVFEIEYDKLVGVLENGAQVKAAY